jgi:dolichol-phosphate mannosyltransferase
MTSLSAGGSETLVIIPTYSELKNVPVVTRRLMELTEAPDVLFIDDASPDGTADVIREQQSLYPGKIHLLERSGKLGLGTAYVTGFRYALEKEYRFICEMDCDLSHSPEDIPRLVDFVRSGAADLAIGSRYCDGISIINWPLSRLILSYSANVYARIITGLPVFDTTAGFKCIRREVLESFDIGKIRSNGYAFQIELHFRAWKAGFRLGEVSIIFREREEGVSKMSKKIVREAIWRVWALKIRSLFGML